MKGLKFRKMGILKSGTIALVIAKGTRFIKTAVSWEFGK